MFKLFITSIFTILLFSPIKLKALELNLVSLCNLSNVNIHISVDSEKLKLEKNTCQILILNVPRTFISYERDNSNLLFPLIYQVSEGNTYYFETENNNIVIRKEPFEI